MRLCIIENFMLPLPLKIFSKHRIMQNRSEPCIWDKYPYQSGTGRQKLVFSHIFMRYRQAGDNETEY